MFEASWEGSLRTRASSDDQVTLEEPQVNSPPGDLQTTTGGYAAPPDWFLPLANSASQASRQSQALVTDASPGHRSALAHDQVSLEHGFGEASAWVWGTGDQNVTLDPWTQFYSRAGPEPGWYDYGNL